MGDMGATEDAASRRPARPDGSSLHPEASSSHTLEPLCAFTGCELLERADAIEIEVPRGEPRQLLGAVADALAAREHPDAVGEKLGAAANAVWPESERGDIAADDRLPLAVAYRLSLPYLARHQAVKGELANVEPLLELLTEEELEERGPALARAAVPALAVDIDLLKDEGYRYVATFPPEGSEGVDVVGKASAWLTRRMTVDGDDTRLAMRRFLAIVAEEIEVELPIASATLDRMLAEPMPAHPPKDRPFLSLARGLVEEAVSERGFPW